MEGALEFKDGPSTPLTSHQGITAMMSSPSMPGAPMGAPKKTAAEAEFLQQERKATRCKVYSIMFLLGLGVLLPWNCVLLG